MYKAVFFDLDHTLWDFERNSKEVLSEIFEDYNLKQLHENLSFEQFLSVYYEINHQLWQQYNHNLISQEQLRNIRFPILFEKLQIDVDDDTCQNLSEEYMLKTPQKSFLMPFALDILQYLKPRYTLYVITNGFPDIQLIKLNCSKIDTYFQAVITSASTGFKKPHPEIFDYAISKAQCEAKQCIMIGDDLEVDINGAKNVGIDAIFYNPKKLLNEQNVDDFLEIDCLLQLMNIL
jgi:putative hydrolase of the HAD superfamily